MSFEIVFSDYTDSADTSTAPKKYDLLPEGEYVLRAEKGEMRKTKTKGTEVATVTFQVVAPKQYEKRKVWHDFYFTSPKAAGLLAKFLVEANSPLVGQGKADVAHIMGNVAGLEIKAAVVIEETNTGNKRNALDPWSFTSTGKAPAAATKPVAAPSSSKAVIDDMFA